MPIFLPGENPKEFGEIIENCPHRKIPDCGCQGHDCEIRQGTNRRVLLQDCVDCVRLQKQGRKP